MNTNTAITASFVALPPVASFTGSPLSGQVPLYVSFTDASTNNPDTWTWNFGDGSAGYEQDPGHVYKTPGTYPVSLTVANAGGNNTMTRAGYITVSSCPNQRFRIARVPTVTYATLQAAYNAALANDIVQSQAFDFTENLNLNRNIAVTFSGGYNCGYTANVPETTIRGSLTIASGTLIADGLIIQ
jgi:PKD repeat protein